MSSTGRRSITSSSPKQAATTNNPAKTGSARSGTAAAGATASPGGVGAISNSALSRNASRSPKSRASIKSSSVSKPSPSPISRMRQQSSLSRNDESGETAAAAEVTPTSERPQGESGELEAVEKSPTGEDIAEEQSPVDEGNPLVTKNKKHLF